MAAGDVWRLSFVGDWSATEQAVCTLHVRFKTGAATFNGACAYLVTNLLQLMKTRQAIPFNWRYINGLTANLTPPMSSTYTTGFPIAGTGIGESLPYTVAIVISLRTLYAGRAYRGRMYYPALSEQYSGSGRIPQADVNAMQTYWEDLMAGVGGSGANADYEIGVWSRKNLVFTPYYSAIVRDIPGTIRRRRPGVGI